MAEKRINELTIQKTVPDINDLIIMDTPIINQGETYKLTIQDLATALSGGILTGDMLKSTYDIDGDGVVGAAHQLEHGGFTYVKKTGEDVVVQSPLGILSLQSLGGDLYLFSKSGSNVLVNNVPILTEAHLSVTNPHNITKDDVGLGNVDNTFDLSKPISISVGLEFLKYVQRDGSNTMTNGYTPNSALAVATKAYVDSKVSGSGTTTYVVLTEAAMVADLSYLVVGDRCVVTSDPTSSKNGDYVCNTAWPVVAPNEIGIWTKIATAGGNLLSDGSVDMDVAYDPPNALSIATKEYVDTKIDPLINTSMDASYVPGSSKSIVPKDYADAADAALQVEVDALKIQYDTYTWTLKGAVVDSDYIVPMFLVIPAGETWVIAKAIYKSGTGAGELTIQQNSSSLAPYSGIQFSTAKSSTTGDSVALTDEAELAPSFALTVASDVTITIQIKKTRS